MIFNSKYYVFQEFNELLFRVRNELFTTSVLTMLICTFVLLSGFLLITESNGNIGL